MISQKITIIVPVYNAAKRLANCLNSIVNQSFANFECILINDGSTDNSLEICQNFANIDSRFIVLDCENQGPSAARNKGLDIVKTPWVTFVDADDYIMPSYLSNFVKYNTDDETTQVIQGYYCEGHDGIDNDTIYNSKSFIHTEVDCNNGLDYVDTNNLLYNWGVWCKIFNTSLLNRYRIRFNENIRCGEDGLFWHTYLCHIDKIIFISEIGYTYFCPRIYSSISRQGTTTYSLPQHIELCQSYKTIYDRLTKKFRFGLNSKKLLLNLYLDNYYKVILKRHDINNSFWPDIAKIRPNHKYFTLTKRGIIYAILNIFPPKLINTFGNILYH